jgi:hypothetical protein
LAAPCCAHDTGLVCVVRALVCHSGSMDRCIRSTLSHRLLAHPVYRRVHIVDSCDRNSCDALAWGPWPRNGRAIVAVANRCQHWSCRNVGAYRRAVCRLHLFRASRLGGDLVDHGNAGMGTPRYQAHPKPPCITIAGLTASSISLASTYCPRSNPSKDHMLLSAFRSFSARSKTLIQTNLWRLAG